MTRTKVARSLLAAALLGVVSCSLAIDVADVDRGCATDQKLCGIGNCVAQSDPAYGCSINRCEPCALMNATSRCSEHTCIVRDCLLGFGCPTDEVGCTANIFVDPHNCGGCDIKCASTETCRNGVCASH